MSTIALYANEVNLMPELIGDIKTSVSNFTTELLSLKGKATNINSSICNLEDVIASIKSSTQTQEDMSDSLDTFQANTQSFISTVDYVDSIVSEAVEQNKDDFYEEYSYLKPDCEKSTGERIAEAIVEAVVTAVVSYINAQLDVVAWCKDHWKLIATALLVVAAIAIIILSGGTALGVFGPLLLMMAQGLLIGAAVGGLVGGAIGYFSGNRDFASFMEGFEDGAFSGAISGAITGGMGSWMSGGVNITLTLGETMFIGGVSNAAASVLGDLGDVIIKGEDISFSEFCFNTSLNFAFGFAFAGIGSKVADMFPVSMQGITQGNGSWAHVWTSQATRSLNQGTKIGLKSILKGLGAKTVKDAWDYAIEPLKSSFQEFVGSLDFLPWNSEEPAGALSGSGGSGW